MGAAPLQYFYNIIHLLQHYNDVYCEKMFSICVYYSRLLYHDFNAIFENYISPFFEIMIGISLFYRNKNKVHLI